ncbi:Uncharacterized protein Adt_01821 [Abeliophyllum distichum]|uniref:Uncharacterized protein n=1 Tax=Abeliophyllum distichum TaxID=126358 RepID=A0ABD1VWC2_9LAMI
MNDKMKMDLLSKSTVINGEEHGKLYPPDNAIHVKTEKKQDESEDTSKGQGDLYSPDNAIHINTQQRNPGVKDDEQQRAKEESKTSSSSSLGGDLMGTPSSKL